MAGHLGRDMRGQAAERPAGQVLQVAAGVLHLVEGTFDPFPQPVEPPLDIGGPGRALVAARRGQDLQAPGLPVALLPVGPEEAPVAEDAAPPHPVRDLLPRHPLVRRGRHQVVGRGHARRGAEQDQLVAEVLQVAAGADPVVGRGRKVAAALVALVADHGPQLGVQQVQGDAGGPQGLRPVPAQGLDPGPQLAGPAVELALAEQLRKEGPVVGPHKAQELGLPRKGQEIHEQQRDHFAVAEAGLGPGPALPAAGRVGPVPVVHPDMDDRRHILECYTARHGEPSECGL